MVQQSLTNAQQDEAVKLWPRAYLVEGPEPRMSVGSPCSGESAADPVESRGRELYARKDRRGFLARSTLDADAKAWQDALAVLMTFLELRPSTKPG